jgi:hypothetical protein
MVEINTRGLWSLPFKVWLLMNFLWTMVEKSCQATALRVNRSPELKRVLALAHQRFLPAATRAISKPRPRSGLRLQYTHHTTQIATQQTIDKPREPRFS